MENTPLEKLRQLIINGHVVCTDSRIARPGNIFFALKGDNFDGNLFVKKALEAGCIAAVADQKSLAAENVFVVDNVLNTLQELSLFHRRHYNIPVIGITGSNGKTTTKELVHAVLSSTFNTLATKGNLNNHIGVPLTLLNLKPEHEIAIIEMGANHVGEVGQLSALALPTFGLITNIGKAHLEGFGSLENIVKTKTELYSYVKKNNGWVFINGDNTLLVDKSEGSRIFYGQNEKYHCSGLKTGNKPFLEIEFKINKNFGQALKATGGKIGSQLVGVYNFENILAALTIGLYFGVSPEKAIEAIERYVPTNSRSQLIENGRNTILLDAYNANPTSMVAAIENFAGFGNSPKAVMLGDMLEMGSSSAEEHTRIIDQLLRKNFELNILVGNEFRAVAPGGKGFMIFDTSTAAAQWLSKNPISGFHILIKGSRGIQMEKVLESL